MVSWAETVSVVGWAETVSVVGWAETVSVVGWVETVSVVSWAETVSVVGWAETVSVVGWAETVSSTICSEVDSPAWTSGWLIVILILFVTVLKFIAQITVHLFLFILIETSESSVISWRKSNKKFCVVDSVCLFSTSSLRSINFKISGTISFISFSERFVTLSFCSKSVLIALLSIVLTIYIQTHIKSPN